MAVDRKRPAPLKQKKKTAVGKEGKKTNGAVGDFVCVWRFRYH